MRVIRTEIYFDDVNGASRRPRSRMRGSREDKYNHGLAFAWFRSDEPGPFDIKNVKAFSVKEIALDQVRPILDALLRDRDGRDIELDEGLFAERIENPDLIDFIYKQTIILEQSPPEAVRFKDLLKRTNAPIYAGTFMGAGLSHDYPALMIITIPLGIIVVSSALGVADAMAAGLNKRVKEMFARKKK
jgi:hypothetical protein